MKARVRPWSRGRDEAWRACRRQYEWRYLVARSPNQAVKSVESREAYRLSKLQTLPMALGQSLHKRAAEYARACKEERAIPTLAESREAVRADLNAIYVSSKRHGDANRQNPSLYPRFFEAEYSGGPSPDEIARTRSRIAICTENLHGLPLWSTLQECGAESIIALDEPVTFRLGDTEICVAPDLVYRRSLVEPFVVVEFKSSVSSVSLDLATIRRQVCVYGLYLTLERGLDLIDGAFEAEIVCFGDGLTHRIQITESELVETVKEIARSADTIEEEGGYSVSQTTRQHPMATDPRLCSRCFFQSLCAPEFRWAPIPSNPTRALQVLAGGMSRRNGNDFP
jgi:hypothetical protein